MKQVSALNYKAVHKAVATEMRAGMEWMKESYRQELVRVYWNIGRVLTQDVGIVAEPNARNAKIMRRLARDFQRPDSFFYDTAKFYRAFPKLPKSGLTWGHYAQLSRVKDPGERRRLESWAKRENINVKDFLTATCLRPQKQIEQVLDSSGTSSVLAVTRGELYHYRLKVGDKYKTSPGYVLLDMGFSVDREVRGIPGRLYASNRIVRAVKEGEDYSVRMAVGNVTRLYTYRALLERVIDGDTICARVDLGFRNWVTQTLRLRGIDTPEVTCTMGRKAKDFVKATLDNTACLVVRTYKQEKYGRFLADIFYKKNESNPQAILKEGTFLNQELIDQGFARPYDGGTK